MKEDILAKAANIAKKAPPNVPIIGQRPEWKTVKIPFRGKVEEFPLPIPNDVVTAITFLAMENPKVDAVFEACGFVLKSKKEDGTIFQVWPPEKKVEE